MSTSPDEVTAAQAAALLGLSERTIRRRIAAGDIPARRVASNRFAINVRDLPAHRAHDVLAARIEALEHRVRLLELQQQGGSPARETAAPAEIDSSAANTTLLLELLAQLARETERLAPLVTPPAAPTARRRAKASAAPRQIGSAREAGNG